MEVVALRFLEDLSEAETARQLGLPLGTVKSRSARALDALRRQLAEGTGDAGG
jgi:DNA-directed RNA polymerase specialized sigma24 family protein